MTVHWSVVPLVDRDALATWNARQEAARDAYSTDPFGGAREGAVAQLYAWRRAGRISAFDYIDGVREVRAWGRT